MSFFPQSVRSILFVVAGSPACIMLPILDLNYWREQGGRKAFVWMEHLKYSFYIQSMSRNKTILSEKMSVVKAWILQCIFLIKKQKMSNAETHTSFYDILYMCTNINYILVSFFFYLTALFLNNLKTYINFQQVD